MPDDALTEQILKRLASAESRLQGVAVQRPRFEVLNFTTKSQITANQNDYDVGAYDYVRISANAARNITGITGGVTGRRLYLRNVGAFNITLVHNSVLSAATNRIFCPGFANVVMTPQSVGTSNVVCLFYELTAWALAFESV